MWQFLPWKFIVKRAALAYGLADPSVWLDRIRGFAKPSEVSEPIELLRAGVLFHARGIVNTKAIQHNLDWIWPYWVVRQFDPHDASFIPRAFSFSHVNLTHRNWTAVGLPELSIYPIVDPRGLVTPMLDGWSIDCWIIDEQGHALTPSRLIDASVSQQWVIDEGLSVVTSSNHRESTLDECVTVRLDQGQPVVDIDLSATSVGSARLVVAVRPYNPEGVQFIDSIATNDSNDGWRINDKIPVTFDRAADQFLVSDYSHGDVFSAVMGTDDRPDAHHDERQIHCDVGMATAAAIFRFHQEASLRIRVPLQAELASMGNGNRFDPTVTWKMARDQVAKLQIPDRKLQSLYDAAIQTLILLSADEVVPGPYTYRRFWFRDACVMMNTLLSIGLVERCRRTLARFPERQLRDGYFRSQDGEWDSNGQVLWIFDRFEQLSGERLNDALLQTIPKAIQWIHDKRVMDDADPLHVGLLPAGFSAEHLGPNDHYYWDDFWAEAGLRGAANVLERRSRMQQASQARAKADELRRCIDRSIERIPTWRSFGGIPASPHRRIDAGAIGSLVADYPLQLYPAGATRVTATVRELLRRCFVKGGFFQDMIHSGINAYLTLDIAQTLLRAGDDRFRILLLSVAELASPTGQWPEAVHPHTGGGCMGDGQHGWAAAEWVMMLRNMFVREEHDRLIVGSGLLPEWLETDTELLFGPTLTPWGSVSIHVKSDAGVTTLKVDANWRAELPKVEIALPGFVKILDADVSQPITMTR